MSLATPSDRRGSAALGAINWLYVLPWAIAALLLAALPVFFASGAALTIMIQMAITIIFALAYNMLLGQGGMLSFGHAVYMGLGGFFCVHLMNMVENDGIPLPLPLLPLSVGLVTSLGSAAHADFMETLRGSGWAFRRRPWTT